MQKNPKKKKYREVIVDDLRSDKGKIKYKQKLTTTQNQENIENIENYKFEEILNLMLGKVITKSNVDFDLKKMKMKGRKKDIEELVKIIDNDLHSMKGLLLQIRPGKSIQDIQYSIEESCQNKAKIFRPKVIQRCIETQFTDTIYEKEGKMFLDVILNSSKQYFYLRISINFQQEFVSTISDFILSNQKTSIPQRQIRGNRKETKIIALEQQYDIKVLNTDNLRTYIKNSRKLNLHDVQISQKTSQLGIITSYIIKLKCNEEEAQTKRAGLNYILFHESFVPFTNLRHKEQIYKQFQNIKNKQLTIIKIKGYKSNKWSPKDLIYQIRKGKISNKKTNYCNQAFEGLHLKGLIELVKQKQNEIEDHINSYYQKELNCEIFIELEDITVYVRKYEQVQKMIENQIKEELNTYEGWCKLKSIKFPLGNIKIQVLVQSEKEQDYNKIICPTIQKSLRENIKIYSYNHHIAVDQQMIEKLNEKGIIVVNYKQNKFEYIEVNKKIGVTINLINQVIRQNRELIQKVITAISKPKYNRYLEIIKELKNLKQFDEVVYFQKLSENSIQFRISLFGPSKTIQLFLTDFQKKVAVYESMLDEFTEIITEEQGRLISSDTNFLQNILNNHKIQLLVSSQRKIEAKLYIQNRLDQNTITIRKSQSLSTLPFDSTLIFTHLSQIKIFNQSFLDSFKNKAKKWMIGTLLEQEKTRNITLIYEHNSIQKVTDIIGNYPSQLLYLIMPQNQKQKFIKDVIQACLFYSYRNRKMFITIIEPHDSNIKQIVGLRSQQDSLQRQEVTTSWFCEGEPYSQAGNNAINDAISTNQSGVYLKGVHLTKARRTHVCDLNRNVIIHLKTKQQCALLIEGSKISFTYKNQTYVLPQQQVNLFTYFRSQRQNKFNLSLPLYYIDFSKMVQLNVYTNFERLVDKLQKTKINKDIYNNKVKAYYNLNINQLVYIFEKKNISRLSEARKIVQQYFKDKKIIKQHSFKQADVTQQFINKLSSRASDYNLECEIDIKRKTVIIKSYYEKDIESFKSILQLQINYAALNITKSIKDIKYPQNWQQQISQIQLIEIDKFSAEFKQLQDIFRIYPIQKLQRIQNKLIYKKYCDEFQHLTYLNKGKQLKKMRLFHGTKHTPPENIYQDKQTGFNINYSSDNNLLGKGTYFAEKAQYSHGYAYKQKMVNWKVGRPNYCMFLCEVIVGDSQIKPMTHANKDIKDTDFKDNVERLKYESMRGQHHICDIYVVYKAARAYPLYLISY